MYIELFIIDITTKHQTEDQTDWINTLLTEYLNKKLAIKIFCIFEKINDEIFHYGMNEYFSSASLISKIKELSNDAQISFSTH